MSTFSPTDTAVLSQRAKVLMIVQALLSVLILGVLVGRKHYRGWARSFAQRTGT